MIRWKRPTEGFVESLDGRWRITPLYWGSTRPQMFELHRDGKRVATYFSTQRDAKASAEQLLDTPSTLS